MSRRIRHCKMGVDSSFQLCPNVASRIALRHHQLPFGDAHVNEARVHTCSQKGGQGFTCIIGDPTATKAAVQQQTITPPQTVKTLANVRAGTHT
ncbi:hypothetical protein [Paenibacillus wenxiniae]|uniref:Uncharacterized protein n=1 Tax=Paenibacillus wenxiniae TaxID=1636843 RepID=A0ABW4RPK9_9BACL